MKDNEEQYVQLKDASEVIREDMKGKIKRNTLTFFFNEEPYMPTKELVLTKWLKEDSDIVDYDKYFKSHKWSTDDFRYIDKCIANVGMEENVEAPLNSPEPPRSSAYGCIK